MHVVRKEQAPPYTAPGHSGMAMRYLQGREAGPTGSVWLGLSVIEPGGGTTLSASAVEKFYVVIEGELEITGQADAHTQTETLRPLDSCRIAQGEARQLANRSGRPASVLLVMPQAQ
jgi:hypothetical protein